MLPLRIALALLALVTAFFLIVPAEPTLFSGAPRSDARVASEDETGIEASGGTPAAAEATRGTSFAPTVRTIGPAPAATGVLTRLPPVASGAAIPPRADAPEPQAPDPAEAAMSGAATDPAAAPPAEVAAAPAPTPDGVTYRLFARPIAVDARTLKSGEFTLLVEGVEPVSGEARCADGAQAWPCATRARTALRGWIRGRSVLCAVRPDQAQAREITAPCLLGEADVGDWIVRNGWAHAAPGSRYEAAEREAREARRGVFAYGLDDEETAARSGG